MSRGVSNLGSGHHWCVRDGSDAKLQCSAKRGGLQTIPSSKRHRQAVVASK